MCIKDEIKTRFYSSTFTIYLQYEYIVLEYCTTVPGKLTPSTVSGPVLEYYSTVVEAKTFVATNTNDQHTTLVPRGQ